jgi:hypothetical protein
MKREELARKILISTIVLTLVLLAVLPIYHVFTKDFVNEVEKYGWKTIYLYNSEDVIWVAAPLYLLFPMSFFINNKAIKLIIKALLFICAGLCSLLGFSGATLLAQDLQPDIGCLVLITIFPQYLLLLFVEYLTKRSKEEAGQKLSMNDET